jgi:hypothetical protein
MIVISWHEWHGPYFVSPGPLLLPMKIVRWMESLTGGLSGWPTLVIMDAKGVIRHKIVGFPEGSVLDELINELVKEAEAAKEDIISRFAPTGDLTRRGVSSVSTRTIGQNI